MSPQEPGFNRGIWKRLENTQLSSKDIKYNITLRKVHYTEKNNNEINIHFNIFIP